jgi:hypothetical protein
MPLFFLNIARPEPVFVEFFRGPEIDSQPGGLVRQPIWRTGPPGYTAGEIDSLDLIPGLHKRLQIRDQKCKEEWLLIRQPFPPSHLHSVVHNSEAGKRVTHQ